MKKYLPVAIALCTALLPTGVFAHAFGQKYTLPLPVWLYVFGGASAVVVSFFFIGYFTESKERTSRAVDLSNYGFFALFATKSARIVGESIGLLLLALTLAAGILGTQNPTQNFTPTFFWLIFLLGFTYVTALLGNIWNTANPFKTLAEWLVNYKPLFRYPKTLGYAPALFFYFVVIWLELLSGGAGVRPENISLYLSCYAVLALAGSAIFGSGAWFYYGDFFSVFFGLISKIAPVEWQGEKLVLRWPLTKLVEESAERLSLVFFIIFMLSSTAFDGFRETIKAAQVVASLSFFNSDQLVQLVLLFGAFGLFWGVYLAGVWGMRLMTQRAVSIRELALRFAFSLIPIALAYNIAHYYTLLLVQGQSIISAVSDPFTFGWNIFGTNGHVVNVGIVGAKTVWESQVFFILAGHISALYTAHVIALRVFGSRRNALLSQLPMLFVMVAYTMMGLWILSQPLTLGR
jgi:hypothetical protein